MPCNFSFVDVDKKGVTGKGLRGDTNFVFLLDWLGVFGFNRTTSKEVSVPWINSWEAFCIDAGRLAPTEGQRIYSHFGLYMQTISTKNSWD